LPELILKLQKPEVEFKAWICTCCWNNA